ncbi:L-type lectin-domain containing receptor kinase SIT2 [Citrus sinensis]|uniref:L-type lectin-domain containing receptor kinase SIT2 n=1 Tax=Citrus sinensis TaxID=2711 RepID=A0ACB8KCZ9_CITSI|nr:L-type lectin-domain containing receptor kinase SIT2 [Citrus sinensis]
MEAFSLLLHLLLLGFAHAETNSFIYNGFIQANLSLDGTAFVRKDGILAVSNDQGRILGHAFYPSPLRFKQLSKYNINNNTISHTALTFSTNFVFSIVPKYPQLGGHGLAFVLMSRKQPPNDILEDWEVEYGACRFRYSELYSATKGFREKNLVGSGGFGKVYRGVIPSTGLEVAIKRVAHNSRQGMKEFVAEITSMGRLRHRNLVQLHGWCRKQDELLLVYDYVPNGSLDKLLFDNDQQKKKILNWDQRYKILIGVAQALLYLHEECDQRVVHRDVKPSNVLIDADLNPKLGDFGLARAYDHNINPQTTHIVGTLGYLAPELTRTGKATTSTDVFGYGTLMLEVACGRRPIEPQRTAMELVLVEWVRELHSQGQITRAIDPTLDYFDPQEAELVLTLGLLCCDPHPDFRPSMRRVVQFLLRDASIPQAPLDIHHEFPRAIPEFSEDDSDPSSCRMTSSTSFTSFDKKESGSSQITRVTF